MSIGDEMWQMWPVCFRPGAGHRYRTWRWLLWHHMYGLDQPFSRWLSEACELLHVCTFVKLIICRHTESYIFFIIFLFVCGRVRDKSYKIISSLGRGGELLSTKLKFIIS
jgi:hypothetical protein